jgi:FIMAH domain-containing protein
LSALPDPILPGTVQNSAISFNDGAYHYVRFDVDAIDITPNSSVIDIDGDGVPDTNDPCPSDPANTCDSSGSAAEEIIFTDGGTITTPDGALTLEVEANDLAEDETLSATKIVDEQALDGVVVSIAEEFAGQPLTMYVLEPDGTQFINQVELIIDVDVTALSPAERSSLDIYLYKDTDDDSVLDTLEPQSAVCVVTEDPAEIFTATCTLLLWHFSTWVSIAAEDSDGDGIFDNFDGIVDVCPAEPSTGFDADADGCIDDIEGLTDLVSSLLDSGIIDSKMENSLLSKLANVQKSRAKENVCAMIDQLSSFNSQVAAQTGKKIISAEAAAKVTAYADSVSEFVSLALPEGETCE